MSDQTTYRPATPVARSAVAALDGRIQDGWEVTARVSTVELTLRDESPLTKVVVRAPWNGAVRKQLGVPFGRTTRIELPESGTVLVIGSGPGEWLLLGPVGAGPRLVAELRGLVATGKEFVSVVDITHGRALFRLRGRAAAHALSTVCGIDLSEGATPDGSAFRTSVARIVTDLVRDDREGIPSYLLHCERSSGRYLFDRLAEAGAEFGAEVSGLDTPGGTLGLPAAV